MTLAYKEEALAKAEGRGHELQAELSKAQVDTERLQREHQELDARYSQTNAEKMRLTQALNKSRLPGGLMDCRSPSYKVRISLLPLLHNVQPFSCVPCVAALAHTFCLYSFALVPCLRCADAK